MAWFKQKVSVMSKILDFVGKLRQDQDGAAMIEYTVLLGVMMVGVMTTIGLVGTWIAGHWTTVQVQLP